MSDPETGVRGFCRPWRPGYREGVKSLVLVLAVALSLVGCTKKKAAPSPAEAASCTSAADCSDGMVCLAGACTKSSSGAIYTDPSNAVTPDKVKRDFEQRGAQHAEDVDKALEAE
jgi:hypothetical protein